MRIAILLVAVFVLVGVAVVVIMMKREPDIAERPWKPADDRLRLKVGDEEVVLVPEGESQARAEKVLPSKASEDMTALLKPLLEVVAQNPAPPEDCDYLPNETIEWVVHVDFEGNPSLDPKKIGELFGREWRNKYGGMTLYGFDPDEKHWTYVLCADGPKRVTRLQIAFGYYSSWSEEPKVASAGDFDRRVEAIEVSSRALGGPTVRTSRDSAAAAAYGKRLARIHTQCNQDALLVLSAPKGERFDGRKVWDVMLCLGLKWGDMDLFHCKNPTGEGDDCYFSVWTTTAPGYFFPEEIAQGKVHVKDLVFGYSIPRSSRPEEIVGPMYKAVQYAQRRLGGTIQDEFGQPAKLPDIQKKIKLIVEELRKNGFEPGGSNALMLF